MLIVVAFKLIMESYQSTILQLGILFICTVLAVLEISLWHGLWPS